MRKPFKFKIQNSNSRTIRKLQNPERKMQNSKPRTIDSEMVTWEQEGVHNCCRQHECPVLPCHRGKSHKQSGLNNKASMDSNEFSWFSYSDETHIHDRGQILKKGLLPNYLGPTPTSYSFVDKIVFAFFPTAATKFRSLPPVQAKNLGPNVRSSTMVMQQLHSSSMNTNSLFLCTHHPSDMVIQKTVDMVRKLSRNQKFS